MENLAKILFNAREANLVNLPGIPDAKGLADQILDLLFPHFSNKQYSKAEDLQQHLESTITLLDQLILRINKKFAFKHEGAATSFSLKLPYLQEKLLEDAESILAGDPAARSIDEIILAYPGFFAIAIYRISHELHALNIPILPRLLTEYAHQVTGIDIHPGALIGHHFFIDHGTGIVIGETTVIKNHVKIYQGVTLGALSVEKGLANKKRHPTIEDNVVIYSNATILGGETVVGKNSIIGGNVWLTASVPEESVVYHSSDVKVKNSKS